MLHAEGWGSIRKLSRTFLVLDGIKRCVQQLGYLAQI